MKEIRLCDNRVGGKTAEITVEDAVRKFRSSKWDDEDHQRYYAFNTRFARFMAFEVEVDGCKRFEPWTEAEINAIRDEYDRQNDSEVPA